MKHLLPELGYNADALEPAISRTTIEFHHGKHHQAYVNNLNSLIEGTEYEEKGLEYIICNANGSICNNAAQAWNHTFYFEALSKDGKRNPSGRLAETIIGKWGSLEGFVSEFSKSASGLFGSGWTWLAEDAMGELHIINEQNAAYPGYPTTPTIFFTSTSTPSNVGWDGQYPQNKDVAFIHEDGENIKFVFNPSISGSSTLCEQETYSIPDVHSMIPDAEIEWKYSGIIMSDLPPFLIIGEQGRDSITYRRGVYFNPLLGDYSQYTGIWDITATVSYVGNEYTMKKKVTMPMQQDLRIQCDDNDGITPIQYFGGATVHLSLREPSDNPSHIKWVCDFDFDDNLEGIPPGSHYTETYYGNSVAIPTYPTFGGTLTVSVYDIGDECNPDRHETWSHHFIPTIIYIDHTNPASGSVDIALSRVAAEGTDDTAVLSAATAQKEPYMGAYRLELWHDHYGLVRSLDSDGNRPTLTLDLYGLTPGIYYIRLLIGGEINSVSKLMVR